MTPILYESSEQSFTSLGLGSLADAISCNVHTVLNGQFELEMTYPVSGLRYSDLKISRIIKAQAEKNGSDQLFDIYAISRPINGIVTVYASHVSGRKQFIPVMPCSASTIQLALSAINSHVAEANPFTIWSDKTTSASFNLKVPVSLGQALGGMQGSLLDVYGGEYEFDNFTIKLWNRRGQDNGVTLRYGKNITSIEQEESIASTITGICPFWASSEGQVITLSEKVVEGANAPNFPFRRTIPKDFSMSFDDAPTEAQLRAIAQAYVDQEGIGVPSVGIDVSYENLADYEEFKDSALFEQVRLGDTVHVYFEPLEITANARVTETIYDTILEKYKKIRIGSVKAKLSTIINDVSNEITQEIEENSNFLEKAFNSAIELLSGADGGNIIINRNPTTGKPYEILIMDTDNASTAQKVLRLNMNGLGLSTSGINGPYTAAITGEGIVATVINTGVLNAALIKTGILSSDNGKYWLNLDTGEMKMKSGEIGEWKVSSNGKALYNDAVDPNDSNIVYRVYLQPPLASNPDSTWVISCQKSTNGGSTFGGTFVLYSDGSAKFGNLNIGADGSLSAPNVTGTWFTLGSQANNFVMNLSAVVQHFYDYRTAFQNHGRLDANYLTLNGINSGTGAMTLSKNELSFATSGGSVYNFNIKPPSSPSDMITIQPSVVSTW